MAHLLKSLSQSVPKDWTVLVLADRGLYARWLYHAIQQQGWHPFLRINTRGKARPKGQGAFHWLASFAPVQGYVWSGEVRCFTEASSRLDCTLLACWDAEHKDPWLILTDLLPEQAEVAWDGLRFWIECGFKESKRGGWDWYYTKMVDPVRASRVWLVMAVAMLWVIAVGGKQDALLDEQGWDDLPEVATGEAPARSRRRYRRLSCFSRGLIAITIALLKGESLPVGTFVDFDWAISTADDGKQGGSQKTSP